MTKTTCSHDYFNISVLPEAYNDTNVRRFRFSAHCRSCGEPVRFLGVDEGNSLSRPCVSPDGQTMVMPAVMLFEEPENEKRLAS